MRYLTILLIALLSSCSSSKELQKEPLLYFGKTACLGKCPVYDVYVFEDGKVEYEGIKNVYKRGKHSYQLSVEELKKLKEELSQINTTKVEKLKRDIPNTIIRFNGKNLKVQDTESIKDVEKILQRVFS